uniref:Uncharacterized protein n=1 Tax=Moniliophthora roreri TaxID=221103 RepID=A0A0W0G8Q2_MONRR
MAFSFHKPSGPSYFDGIHNVWSNAPSAMCFHHQHAINTLSYSPFTTLSPPRLQSLSSTVLDGTQTSDPPLAYPPTHILDIIIGKASQSGRLASPHNTIADFWRRLQNHLSGAQRGWWIDKRQQSGVNADQTITTNAVGKQEDWGGKSPSLPVFHGTDLVSEHSSLVGSMRDRKTHHPTLPPRRRNGSSSYSSQSLDRSQSTLNSRQFHENWKLEIEQGKTRLTRVQRKIGRKLTSSPSAFNMVCHYLLLAFSIPYTKLAFQIESPHRGKTCRSKVSIRDDKQSRTQEGLNQTSMRKIEFDYSLSSGPRLHERILLHFSPLGIRHDCGFIVPNRNCSTLAPSGFLQDDYHHEAEFAGSALNEEGLSPDEFRSTRSLGRQKICEIGSRCTRDLGYLRKGFVSVFKCYANVDDLFPAHIDTPQTNKLAPASRVTPSDAPSLAAVQTTLTRHSRQHSKDILRRSRPDRDPGRGQERGGVAGSHKG